MERLIQKEGGAWQLHLKVRHCEPRSGVAIHT